MTYEESIKLRNDEINGTLRLPINYNAEKDKLHLLLKDIYYLLVAENGKGGLLQKLYLKFKIKKHKNVISFSGKNTRDNPHNLKTSFGKGNFFDAHDLFTSGKYPDFIKNNYCFSNAMSFLIYMKSCDVQCEMLSGIAYFKTPFLHSVILIHEDEEKPQIIDFNFNLVMDYDLYISLFQFETLCVVEKEKLLADIDVLLDKRLTLSCCHVCLAYDDALAYKKNKLQEMDEKINAPIDKSELLERIEFKI